MIFFGSISDPYCKEEGGGVYNGEYIGGLHGIMGVKK